MNAIKYVEAPITEYLHQKAARLLSPLNGTFELTPVCNMSCRMCYVRMTRAEQEAIRPLRTAEEWLQLGATAKERGMLYLLLTGGEPFSRPDFREIMEGLQRVPPTRMNITLYGASDETYARLCRNPQGFSQATHAIHLLKDAGITATVRRSRARAFTAAPGNAASG